MGGDSLRMKIKVFLLFLCLFFSNLYGHQLKEDYLKVDYNQTTQHLKLTFEIETRLFEQHYAFLDDSQNGIVSFRELRHHQSFLLKYIGSHIQLLYRGKSLPFINGKVEFHRYQVQTYMRIVKEYNHIDIHDLTLKYNMFYEMEPIHKLFINIKNINKQVLLDNKHREYRFSQIYMTQLERFEMFVVAGVKHILSGIDHIMFLFMLILPVVITHSSWKDLLITITGFSVAHSITLFIAGAGIYIPNAMIVESGIALSIAVVALLNLLGQYNHVNYKIAFAFGLLHGFGFADVLHIAGISSTLTFIVSLFGFNLGVELGQILIVLSVLPLFYLLSKLKFHMMIYRFIMIFVFVLSVFWVLQRVGVINTTCCST